MSRKETEKATKLIARLTGKNPAMIDIENNPVSAERQTNLKTEQKTMRKNLKKKTRARQTKKNKEIRKPV